MPTTVPQRGQRGKTMLLAKASNQSTGKPLMRMRAGGAHWVAIGAATRWSGMPNASTSFCEHGASSLHSALGAPAANPSAENQKEASLAHPVPSSTVILHTPPHSQKGSKPSSLCAPTAYPLQSFA